MIKEDLLEYFLVIFDKRGAWEVISLWRRIKIKDDSIIRLSSFYHWDGDCEQRLLFYRYFLSLLNDFLCRLSVNKQTRVDISVLQMKLLSVMTGSKVSRRKMTEVDAKDVDFRVTSRILFRSLFSFGKQFICSFCSSHVLLSVLWLRIKDTKRMLLPHIILS